MSSDKCHLFISGNKFEHLWAKIGNDKILEIKQLTLDNEFNELLNNAYLIANRKLPALSRIKK